MGSCSYSYFYGDSCGNCYKKKKSCYVVETVQVTKLKKKHKKKHKKYDNYDKCHKKHHY